jgi:hypothetical protein
MTILNYILRGVIQKSNHPIFNICVMFFFSDGSNKFENLKGDILDNGFFTESQKEVYLDLFSTAQKHTASFSKFAKIWKYRKYDHYNNDVDLCLTPLSSFPESQKITLIHLKKKYIFRLTDLMNIWIIALTKNKGFSPAPKYPMNPYINRPFRKHHLCNIYFKLLDSTFIIPQLIQNFYKLNLNITKFEIINYPILKDYAINNYLQNMGDVTLFFDIIHMVETFRIELEYSYIDPNIPADQIGYIVMVMKPFLRDFFIGTLSCNPLLRELSRSSALNGLRCFFIRRPLFGTLLYHSFTTDPTEDTERLSSAETEEMSSEEIHEEIEEEIDGEIDELSPEEIEEL